MSKLKDQLFTACAQYVQQRLDSAKQAMHQAQEAANSEEKSSAGDKYETGRAMAQIARDQAAQQLDEALKLQNSLSRIKQEKTTDRVGPGSLVKTTTHLFFIAIPAGKILVEGEEVLAVSLSSPLGKSLAGLKAGDSFPFQGKKSIITQVL